MLMTRKRKLKIAKLIAETLYIGEADRNVSLDTFMAIADKAFDVLHEVGGISLIDYMVEYYKKLGREGVKK